jgi:hypothetical protein
MRHPFPTYTPSCLLQRLAQLKGELDKQEARRQRLGQQAAGAAQAADSLDARLARVAQFQVCACSLVGVSHIFCIFVASFASL